MSSDGSCPLHPAIRLKRFNRRTNEWKTLLETCPLCASGLPASSSAASVVEPDDDESISSRYSSRGSITRTTTQPSSAIPSDDRSLYSAATTQTGYSAATTQTGTTANTFTTGNTDMTYITRGEEQSLSSLSTRKQRNGSMNNGGGDYRQYPNNYYREHDYMDNNNAATRGETDEGGEEGEYDDTNDRPYTDDEGYNTEDNETDLDSSGRSGMTSKGVTFGPGTKEASEAGTDLESEADLDVNYDSVRDSSIHSNYDPYDKNENDELNDYMQRGGTSENKRSSTSSSQYSNTPPVKNPLPSALKPSTMGSLVVYDGGNNNNNRHSERSQSDHNSSLTSLHDDQSHQQQQYAEKQKYRPPPPPRRFDDSLVDNTRSTSRSRNERSASRSRDARPAPPERPTSQPRSSSRSRGSSNRGRDSSRSRPREGDSRTAPPPGRARSQSRPRQPSRSRGREDRSQPPPQQRPSPPVGILRRGIHSSSSSSNLYNPKEAKDDDDSYRNEQYNDNYSPRPGPPPRSSGMSPQGNNRMRMEPPETPADELDNYSLNSRDTHRRHTVGAHHPPRHGPLQEHQRRATDQSGQIPNMNHRTMPQAPRSGPVYMHDDHRDNASLNSYERRGNGHPTPPSRRMHPPGADHSESSSEHKSRSKNTPKKGNRRHEAGLTESETNMSDEAGKVDPNDSEAPVMTQASEYDDKGRCVKHPHIKLRKKKMLGGWKVMLVNCPDCCIEEMLRMRRNGPGRAGQANPKSKKKRSPSEDSHSSGAHPPISQLTIRNKNEDDDDRSSSSGSASEITYGTKTDYSRSTAMGSWQQYGPGGNNPSADNSGTSGSGPHRVTRMPFTDAYGHKGWYTGEVASGSGLPHGKGTMHYCDGRMRGGLWSNGLVAAGGGGGGGGGGVGGNPNRVGKVSSNDSVGSHHSQHSRRSRNPPPPPGNRENVVVGMEWMDYDGKDGFFTGETDDKGQPHGMGSMRYSDGKVLEGQWYHGEFDRPGRSDGSVKTSRSRNRGY